MRPGSKTEKTGAFSPLVALVLLALAVPHARASSCCGAGTSSVSEGHPTPGRGTLLFVPGTDYAKSSTGDFQRERISLGVAYGVFDRLSVSMRANYAWLQVSQFRPGIFDKTVVPTDTILPDTTFHFDNNGFGDGSVGLQFVIVPQTVLTRQELKIGADVGIPWATYNDSSDVTGARQINPPRSQNGTGVLSLGGFASYGHSFPAQRLSAAATVGGRVRLRDRNEARPGSDIAATASVVAGPFWKLKGILTSGYGLTGRTVDKNDKPDTTSGGSRISLTPGVELALSEKVQVSLDGTIPVWQSREEKRNGTAVGLRLSAFIFIPVFAHEE